MATLKLGSTTAITESGGALTIASSTLTTPTIASMANCTFPAGTITKYERTLSSSPALQNSTSSWATVTGTSVSYTPQTGASKVYYRTKFFLMGNQLDAHMIMYMKMVHDGTTVADSRHYYDSRSANDGHFTYGPTVVDYVLPAWSGAKTTSVGFRDHTSSYQATLHEIYIYHESDTSTGVSADLPYPIETIMYSIM